MIFLVKKEHFFSTFLLKEEKGMIKHPLKAILLLVLAVFLLGGCSASFEEEYKEAVAAVEKEFKETPEDRNKENQDIEYYLPFGFEVDEETPNNLILKNGSKTYILFYNLQEGPNSDVVLNATLQQKEYDMNEHFNEDGKLGYFLVKKLSENENEVTIGVGGVKVTSEVKTKNLKSDTEYMMKIANSVKAKK